MKIKKKILASAGLIISVAATVLIVMAITGRADGMMMVKGIAGSLIAYIIGGGFGYAINCILAILRFGLMRIPVYPFDFVTLLLGIGLGLIIIISIPVIFVGRNLVDANKEPAVG